MAFDARPFSEERDANGAPRPGYGRLLEALAGVDLTRLSAEVNRHLALRKVNFGSRPFVVDPVPRMIPADEWDVLAAGLTQRARALNQFLRDAYGAQRIVAAGIVPLDVIREAEGFEPDLMGRLPATPAPAAIIGFDVVRDPDGRFLVLEDNARTPSGYEYALAARRALTESLPDRVPRPRPVERITGELLLSAMRAAAPAHVSQPSMVVLTDGPANVAYSEHARAAARIGVPLVTLDQLIAAGDGLRVSLPGGEERAVHVVYRRSDEDRLRDRSGRLTDVAWALLPAWLSGNLGIVNAFGTGLADDKLVHGHVEDFVRFYLREEPLVGSVPTHSFAEPVDQETTHERLRRHVVKPRRGHGGNGVVIGPHASPAELERLAREVTLQPARFISQPTVALSRHPTVIAGRLEPRHIDLRAFAFSGGEVGVMPGGLSRVALEKDKLIVNSSQAGGGKDTWIVDEPS